jgi:predicted glycoside hydrolase/deacetylase ChbG (UPF0249 family)
MTAAGTDRILVVNADDYGLTPGVCRGIIDAHRDGIVTSTSVLTPAPAFGAHARTLRESGLAAGLHLCAVGEDPPLLSAREVPTLVDRNGRFALTWKQFVRRAVRGQIDAADLAREFEAQHAAVVESGIRPTHVDSHQNLHLWPSVSAVVIDLAVRHQIPVLRVTRTQALSPLSTGVRFLGARAARRARRAGLVVPDAAVGLDTAGAVDEVTLRAMIERLGKSRGHADLTVHPGEDPDPDRDRYAWGYSWPGELQALTSRGLREHVKSNGLSLGSFADLANIVGSPLNGQ